MANLVSTFACDDATGVSTLWNGRLQTLTILQREEPIAASGRAHGKRHQADVRLFGCQWTELQLCEVKLTVTPDTARRPVGQCLRFTSSGRPVHACLLQSRSMRVVPAHRRLTSWIAALALLLASLAPAVSHALASANGTNWIEICTTQGSKWIEAGKVGSERSPASAHALDCPYCPLHAPTLGLPPASQLEHLSLRLGHEVPLAFLSAPRTLHAWVSAQPRAPPLFS
jgi:hypothetical protein